MSKYTIIKNKYNDVKVKLSHSLDTKLHAELLAIENALNEIPISDPEMNNIMTNLEIIEKQLEVGNE